MYDGRGLKCPLAFVQAKWHLLKQSETQFLLDDQTSVNNFCSYLTKKTITFKKTEQNQSVFIEVE